MRMEDVVVVVPGRSAGGLAAAWSPTRQKGSVGVAVIPSRVFFFQAEDGIRDLTVTGVQTCALPISLPAVRPPVPLVTALVQRGAAVRLRPEAVFLEQYGAVVPRYAVVAPRHNDAPRSEEHTSELQSQSNLVCRLLLEKKKTNNYIYTYLYQHYAVFNLAYYIEFFFL